MSPGASGHLVYSRLRVEPIQMAVMVSFINPHRPATEQISVWCERQGGEFHLVRREPGGALHTQRCADRAALVEATARLQTALTRSGWQPADMARTPMARHRATRAGQFHR